VFVSVLYIYILLWWGWMGRVIRHI